MTDIPDPPTPAECDLRGMPYMPLDVVRLFDSDLYILSTGDEFKAAVTLWGKSFLQVPAGSLTDDDRILGHLSGAKSWPKVREMALRGWYKCSDGRLYHPTVAEKVMEAWQARLAQRQRTAAARAARAASRNDNPPPSPAASGVRDNVTYRTTEDVTRSVAISVTDNVTGSKLSKGKGREESSPPLEPPPSPPEAVQRASAPPLPGGDKSDISEQNQKAKSARPRQTRGTRLAPDWTPSPHDLGIAEQLGLRGDAVAQDFADYWHALPGMRAMKLDWQATWRRWCRKEADHRPKPKPTAAERHAASVRESLRMAGLLDEPTRSDTIDVLPLGRLH